MKVILASGSPRRRELMATLVSDYEVVPSQVEEIIPENVSPDIVAQKLAILKAEDVANSRPDAMIIGSDTVVDVDGKILGKPCDEDEAFSMLKLLSGRSHLVHTGVAVVTNGVTISFVESTEVTFVELSDEEIRAYVKTGEPMDKAGAYGIQGIGARLVSSIKGDFYTVMGFPVAKLYQMLKNCEGFGI